MLGDDMDITKKFFQEGWVRNNRAEELPMTTIVLVIIVIIVIAIVLIFVFSSFSGSTAQTSNFTFLGTNGSKIAAQNATDLLK
jgi:flagellar basal body-associated protein FliL